MHTTPHNLRLAQAEVQRTAHDQDLIEVPRRARLEREAEAKTDRHPPVHRAEKPESHSQPHEHLKVEAPLSFERYANRRFFNSAVHLTK
jgi:hypothetical protein